MRVGGDEFAILLRELGGADELASLAQRLLGSLSAPYELAGQLATVTCSIGLACGLAPGEAESLLAAADAAMYGAKRKGKNAYLIAF